MYIHMYVYLPCKSVNDNYKCSSFLHNFIYKYLIAFYGSLQLVYECVLNYGTCVQINVVQMYEDGNS